MVHCKYYNILAVLLAANVASVLSVPVSVPSDGAVSGSERLGPRTGATGLAEGLPISGQGPASGSHPTTLVARGGAGESSQSQTNAKPSLTPEELEELRAQEEEAKKRLAPHVQSDAYRAAAMKQIMNRYTAYLDPQTGRGDANKPANVSSVNMLSVTNKIRAVFNLIPPPPTPPPAV
ncbi:hypothetical protein EV360DRAFT_82033 [Lentinula raphanica]|nr:hypothetical protein EV360DRAFT_82033 [Lentinula raphanica]